MLAVKNLSMTLLTIPKNRYNTICLAHAQGLVIASFVRGLARDQELTLQALERGLMLTTN